MMNPASLTLRKGLLGAKEGNQIGKQVYLRTLDNSETQIIYSSRNGATMQMNQLLAFQNQKT